MSQVHKGAEVFSIAMDEIGYKESPPNTNKTKYGEWFGLNGTPWCAIFVSYCYAKAGYPLESIGFTKGFAGCQTAVAHYVKTDQAVSDPQLGDIVFFDWNSDGRYDHVGIFVRRVDKDHFETIEGNTSITNQSNGGEVMRRRRPYKGVLFVRPTTQTP